MGRKHRIHGAKGRSWKKGHSSDSNPTSRKHRDLVKMALAAPPSDAGEEKLDSAVTNPLKHMSLDALEETQSLASVDTKLTEFTNCTNPTFESIHRFWRSGSQIHTDVVAVLAAVTELINENGGQQSDVEFFSAILTTLGGCDPANATQVAATAFLLSLVMKKLDHSVLRAQFGRASQIIYGRMSELADGTQPHALKQLISCLSVLLCAQHPSVWNASSNRSMVAGLATFALHDNPYVRKLSRRAVHSILCNTAAADDQAVQSALHSVAKMVADFCIEHIEQSGGLDAQRKSTLRVLQLLECIMHRLPAASFKQLCETLLRLQTFAHIQVKLNALDVMLAALKNQPLDSTLTADTCCQLILALYDFQPLYTDSNAFARWSQVICEAHVCLQVKDPTRLLKLLPRTTGILLKAFELCSGDTAAATALTLERLVEYCYLELKNCPSQTDATSAIDQLICGLDNSLTLKNAAHWDVVFAVVQFCFCKIGAVCAQCPHLSQLINTLTELRDDEETVHRVQIDAALGAAIRYVGVETVIECTGFRIDVDAPSMPLDLPRAWLLPLLRTHVKEAPLAYFASQILPCALKLSRRIKTWQESSSTTVLAKVYSIVETQLWDLLPAFCHRPTDFCLTFKSMAQPLGMALVERLDIRLTLLSALRALLKFAREKGVEEQQLMASYAKNYMPILFNIYTASEVSKSKGGYDSKGVRLSALETIRSYAHLTPEDQLETYTQKVMDKLTNADESDDVKRAILDILVALGRCMSPERTWQIIEQHRDWFNASSSFQKKAFRLLEEMGKADKAEVHQMEEVLLTEGQVLPEARAAKVSVLLGLIDKYDTLADLDQMVQQILPSLVQYLDTKESEKTRRLAAKALVAFGAKIVELSNPEELSERLSSLLNRLWSVLPTDVPLTSLTKEQLRPVLIAANLFVRKFGNVFESECAARLIERSCVLLGDDRHSVVKINISLLKAAISYLPKFVIDQYVHSMLSAVFGDRPDASTRNLKSLNSTLFRFLARKLGADFVGKYATDTKWEKQWKHVQKVQRRKERKRSVGRSLGTESYGAMSTVTSVPDTMAHLLRDSDSEDDMETRSVRSRTSRKSGSVWLKEGNDEVVDLLERGRLAQHVTSTDPSIKQRASKPVDQNRGFKVSADGRLVIAEETTAAAPESDDSDDEDENLLTSRKRRARSVKSEPGAKVRKTDILLSKEEMPTWAPGGKGIHRAMNKAEQIDTGKNFKAKKAQGDVQLKGQKLKPFAYVPIRRSKKQAKLQGQLKHIVQGARKGATKGKKGKRRQKIVPI